MIKLIESPREAMQGIVPFIPTEVKVEYIKALLNVGFDTVEVGSLVSPKAVPQMSDTLELIKQIETTPTNSKRMLLVVNRKGAEIGVGIDSIETISYPFSISPKFSELNLNSTPEKQLITVKEIYDLCEKAGKLLVVYISMAFGNPYGDEWNLDLLGDWVSQLGDIGIKTIPLSNVTLEIDKELIADTFSTLIPRFPEIELGLHLHTANIGWFEKVDAAFSAGCRRYDGVMQGMGGCPMTGKELLGNLSTENLVSYMQQKNALPDDFNFNAFEKAKVLVNKINLSNG